ncbi:hypothetical protein CTAYLR_004430 [Chrysophaeum taylorii]|uniref:Uncharacterized protein n=1 Tax=Chrysophaeum taylorii TaxID=2483200 RepID=A0AAD7UDU7_9STRA|nr:hypothetical protein CTAYLR_004430 [Chrysophaeum taylorii]
MADFFLPDGILESPEETDCFGGEFSEEERLSLSGVNPNAKEFTPRCSEEWGWRRSEEWGRFSDDWGEVRRSEGDLCLRTATKQGHGLFGGRKHERKKALLIPSAKPKSPKSPSKTRRMRRKELERNLALERDRRAAAQAAEHAAERAAERARSRAEDTLPSTRNLACLALPVVVRAVGPSWLASLAWALVVGLLAIPEERANARQRRPTLWLLAGALDDSPLALFASALKLGALSDPLTLSCLGLNIAAGLANQISFLKFVFKALACLRIATLATHDSL